MSAARHGPDGTAEPGRGSGAGAGGTAAALGGLLLAVAGLVRPAAEGGSGPMRTVLRLPDPVIAFLFLSAALAVVVLLGLLVPGGRRRRRKGDEEFELVYEQPKVSPLALAAVWALLLLPLAVGAYLFWSGAPWLEHVLGPPSGRPAFPGPAATSTPPLPTSGDGGAAAVPFFTTAVTILAIGAGLALTGGVLWILFGDRLAWWWAGPLAENRKEPFVEAAEESLDDLSHEPDPRRAIILCYRRFELGLAKIKAGRAPWQTPTEFMREVLARLALPPGSVWQLTRLFEISRFSAEPLGPAEREAARRALEEIRAALKGSRSDASAR
jgi:hypothetical protein